MSSVTLPLSLLQSRNANSYKEHQKLKAERENAEPALSSAVGMRDRVDDWCAVAAKYDNELEDFAAHKKGLVVLDGLRAPVTNDDYNQLSGDLSINQTTQQKSKASLSLSSQSVDMTYSKKANREIYTESYRGHVSKLILDHDNGTLTYFEPNE